MADVTTLGIRVTLNGAREARRGLDDVADSAGHTEKAADRLASTMRMLTGVFAGYKAVEFARESLDLAARYETLGVVMGVVGRNAGRTQNVMEGLQVSLQKTGISAIESRQNLIRMAQAHLDLAQATRLARIAQDAAVIGNVNSSQAFETLIHGIQSGQTDVLRTIGINVNFENSYQRLAAQLGVAKESLNEQQRTQARANVVMASGASIAGAYEAAMGTAGKQIKSTERYLEDMRVKVASAFLPEYTQAVFGYANGLKWLGENAPIVTGAVVGLATAVGGLALAMKGGSLLALLNPATLVTVAAIATLATVIGSAATQAALARRETSEFNETLKHLGETSLRRNIDQTAESIR